ncbi:MAG: hypothetical protein KIY12_05255 [Thermoplasmata archaeon]|uniref:Uncharacterized protein n=1 Tax=Candidatus Sysuiplasma superficiale TaxID=2823368 RepID=A0A8J7YQ45_9ARCH|nr:hypothetical protein [Candidatus Sysuiplasma superficiale]MBX8644116.1 hypothetical protein [Candidatus Sysuiplasma superficiale]MCL4346483.1 HisA/HisF-related TIM barrel protein [Candidatus Thermoplasmatota archaeon]
MSGSRIIEVDFSKGYAIIQDEKVDPFSIVDALQGTEDLILMHDLDSIRRNRQQLDILQDLSEEIKLWYEGGLRFADSLIDPLVSGAEKVVVSNAYFSDEEYEKAIRMTDSVVIDADADYPDGIREVYRSRWNDLMVGRLVAGGYSDVIISSRIALDVVRSLRNLNVDLWIRSEGQIDELIQKIDALGEKGIKVAGRVAPVEELIEANE